MSGLKPTNTNTQPVEREIEAGNAERAQDLAELQNMAGGEAPPAGELVEQPPQGPGLAQELEDVLTMALGIFGPLFPTAAALYTPEMRKAAAGTVAAVCNKRGWMQGGLMGEYGEELTCAMVVGPLAVATYKAAQADIAARKPAPEVQAAGAIDLTAPEPAAAGVTVGSKTVTLGVVQ